MSVASRQVQNKRDASGVLTGRAGTVYDVRIKYKAPEGEKVYTKKGFPTKKAAEQHEAAGAIYHESRRLEALSYKLLSLLSLSDERLELAPVDLTDLWPRLRMACPQVPLLTPQGGAVVHGDADLLLDLLCNLVQNAAKASPAGMPVTVLLADAGDTVALTVQDHGCGIPADKLARVTEPFYMVDKSRARKQGGSGMGLALCQRIAAVHGGTLQISSQVGVGTAVTVTLPKEVQP